MILNLLLRMIPQQYTIGVAIKKMSYGVGKAAVALLAWGKVHTLVGSHLTPDQIMQVQTVAATCTAALAEGLHDWARIKWPDKKWL